MISVFESNDEARSVILSGMRNARTRNVYYESFRNDYAASGFLWQMEFFHRLVTSANLAYGRTIQPTMLAPALGFAAGLGPQALATRRDGSRALRHPTRGGLHERDLHRVPVWGGAY
ncbi:MAG: hypothetical protein ACYCVM_08775, partial [Acidiferrobacter sp.]